MAKNFDKMSEDNPVMSILGAAAEEAEKNNVEAFSTKAETPVVTENVTAQTSENKENITEPKKILMNISIRESTKKEWKMFFLEHDLSMTQGIETAVEFLKSEVSKGNIKLSKGGITK